MNDSKKTKLKKQTKQAAKAAPAKELNTMPVEVTQKTEQKSILKPFAFFAVFVALVGGAVLYPYLTEPLNYPVMLPQEPPLTILQPQEKVMAVPEQVSCDCPATTKDDDAIAALKATIHDLEIENLSLKERMNAAESTTPALIELLRNIYVGRPFAKQLNQILREDKMNAFALEIQKEIGNLSIKGIPTSEQVENLFDSRFQMALDSYYVTRETQTYWEQAKTFVKSLVRVYPENVTTHNAKGIAWLYLAQKQVDANDFDAAIQSLHNLPDQSSAFFIDFIKAAEQRVLANRIINAYFQGKEK